MVRYRPANCYCHRTHRTFYGCFVVDVNSCSAAGLNSRSVVDVDAPVFVETDDSLEQVTESVERRDLVDLF